MGIIRKTIKTIAASPGAWPVVARVVRGEGITTLMYHRIQADGNGFQGPGVDTFREQMRWLKAECMPVHPDQFVEVLQGRRTRRPAVLVTFDDGYRDYHDHVYPVLKELEIPAVVFLATRFVDEGGMIWTDAVTWAVHHSPVSEVDLPWPGGSRFDLSAPGGRRTCVDACKAFLKNIGDEERNRWQEQLFQVLAVDPLGEGPGRQMLNWDEVRATMEYTTYGGHTHTHPILSRVDSLVAEREIRKCRDRIREETGVSPRYFAYPNGRAQDFTEETKNILQREGFELAFSTVEGIQRRGMDPFAIRRQPTGARTIGDFAWLVAGR